VLDPAQLSIIARDSAAPATTFWDMDFNGTAAVWKINTFGQDGAVGIRFWNAVHRAYKRFHTSYAAPRTLILDLTGNGGGVICNGIRLLSLLVDDWRPEYWRNLTELRKFSTSVYENYDFRISDLTDRWLPEGGHFLFRKDNYLGKIIVILFIIF